MNTSTRMGCSTGGVSLREAVGAGRSNAITFNIQSVASGFHAFSPAERPSNLV